ncbi:MAG: radical SAM protein [Candidatus Gastranaerophilaceae bacterium]|jgi:anaerobic magnesium-protoporphyrin IX monomethyl ester cyclase
MPERIIIINVINPKISPKNPTNIFEIQEGPHFPLGIAFLANFIIKNNKNTPLLLLDDQMTNHETIIEKMKKFKPTIVGINSKFKSYVTALNFARVAKKLNTKVVMGGAYPSGLHREILINRGPFSNDYCVDAVIRGDGEDSFYQYILKHHDQTLLAAVNNLTFCSKKEIIVNPIQHHITNESAINFNLLDPRPYFKKYQKNFPTSKIKNPFIVQSHKGCAWREKTKGGCIFCSLINEKLTMKNPKQVWTEINKLVKIYNVDYIWDISDDILSDEGWFDQYFEEALKLKCRPKLKIQSRADNLIDKNIYKKLKKLKIEQLFIGFESNDDNCLKRMNKNTTEAINEQATNLLLKHNIPIAAYFTLGNPGETKKSLKKTIKLAEKIIKYGNSKNIVVPSFFTALPNSTSFNILKQQTGKKYEKIDIFNWKEIIQDWINNNCEVSNEEIKKSINNILSLSKNINSFSY